MKTAIIGGGPAGCISAIFASENFDNHVTIFEKKDLLYTLLCTGGGRCNLAFEEYDFKELAKFYPRGEKFLYSVFSQFALPETLEFFENIGVKTYTQEDLRIFPTSNSARDVRNKIVNELKQRNVIVKNKEIKNVQYENEKFYIENEEFDFLIISTGGKGCGYNIAKEFGHTITELKPSLSGLKMKNILKNDLSGVTLKNVQAKACFDNQKYTLNGDLLFLKDGITGPLAYKISSYYAFCNYSVSNPINLLLNFTSRNSDDFELELRDVFEKNKQKDIKNVLNKFIPNSLAEELLDLKNIDKNKKVAQINKQEFKNIISLLCELSVDIISTVKNGEIVTAGGVVLDEINPKTLESKICKNLYFCGEILNIDGLCGGFNLQNCWATGAIAGKNISLK